MTNGEKFKEVFGFGADGSRVIAVNAIWWDCEFQNSKSITNADRIRPMSDEELRELLVTAQYSEYPPWHRARDIRDWLEQEG